VKIALGVAAFILQAMVLAPASAAPPSDARPGVAEGQITTHTGKTVSDNRLPINRRFPNLDAYLAHLEKGSHMDGAWYREVRPGVYELQTGNLRLLDGAKRKRIFTRQELEEKFGFSR